MLKIITFSRTTLLLIGAKALSAFSPKTDFGNSDLHYNTQHWSSAKIKSENIEWKNQILKRIIYKCTVPYYV
jgi:hypothetical protein